MFTTIDHDARRKFDLTLNEYAICDSIYFLSRSKQCNASKEYLGEFIGISRKQVHVIIKKLKLIGLVTGKADKIQTSELWNNEILKLHTVTKGDTECNQRLHSTVTKGDTECNQRLHNIDNINTLNNNNNIINTLSQRWNTLSHLRHHKSTTAERRIKKKHIDEINDYSIEVVYQAFENYNAVCSGNGQYWWTHRTWTMWEFIARGLDKFVPEANPLKTFKKDEKDKPQKKSVDEQIKETFY